MIVWDMHVSMYYCCYVGVQNQQVSIDRIIYSFLQGKFLHVMKSVELRSTLSIHLVDTDTFFGSFLNSKTVVITLCKYQSTILWCKYPSIFIYSNKILVSKFTIWGVLCFLHERFKQMLPLIAKQSASKSWQTAMT